MTCEHLLDQVARQSLFTDGLFSQSQPELTGLQSHILIWILGPLQHVLVKKTTTKIKMRQEQGRVTLVFMFKKGGVSDQVTPSPG